MLSVPRLVTTAIVGTVVLVSAGSAPVATRAAAAAPLDPSTLTKFVDALPVPLVAKPTTSSQGIARYTLTARQFSQRLHRDMPGLTRVLGFDDGSGRPGSAGYPGPTIDATSGKPITVTWQNALPATPILPVDPAIMGASEHGPTAISPHLHGGNVPDSVDGGPDRWFEPGTARTYTYPNGQQAATLWYHDHAIGITRLNVYEGLAGYYLIRDNNEKQAKLPDGANEIPLVIQDRSFTQDGQLAYPTDWQCHFFGDTALVNGKVWPYLDVEPRRYRFRILNGSNTRSYSLSLFESDTAGAYDPSAALGPSFVQVGTDGGLLRAPVTVPRKLTLAAGERADVVVDFSALAGHSLLLRNEAVGGGVMDDTGMGGDMMPCGANGEPIGGSSLPDIMLFNVSKPLSSRDRSQVPTSLNEIASPNPAKAAVTRDFVLGMEMSGMGGGSMGGGSMADMMKLTINGKGYRDPVTDFPVRGTSEIWQFINTTPGTHPMHVHLVQFLILDRQRFARDAMGQPLYGPDGNLVLVGSPRPPDPNEAGWKDTVRATPGEVTRIIIRFDSYTGTYVLHCHILEHEEHDMMRPFTVVSKKDAP